MRSGFILWRLSLSANRSPPSGRARGHASPGMRSGSRCRRRHWTSLLQARFRANGAGARVEGGYRIGAPSIGVVPYAAARRRRSGCRTRRDRDRRIAPVRTEFRRADRDRDPHRLRQLVDAGMLLDRPSSPSTAVRLGERLRQHPARERDLPGLAGIQFRGERRLPARDGALVTGGAQVSLSNGWSFLAKFDGEFSSTTSIYSGSGMVKKAW